MNWTAKDYSLPEGKLWTFRGWYSYGLRELPGLVICVPLIALLAWGFYSLLGNFSQMYPSLAPTRSACVSLCIGAVPFSACVLSRFVWWGCFAVTLLIYPLAPSVSSLLLGLLLLAVPFRCVLRAVVVFCRNGRAADYVHVIGVSGLR
jgi:hypothetical protein